MKITLIVWAISSIAVLITVITLDWHCIKRGYYTSWDWWYLIGGLIFSPFIWVLYLITWVSDKYEEKRYGL